MPAGILGNHKMNYIIAGTPRSGTGFMAKLMTSAGVPIGHEMFFGMPGHGYYPQNAQGDSSWMAVPYMQNFKEATKIHLVRNPLENLTSLINIRTFSDQRNIYTEFKKITMPGLDQFEGKNKYLAFYIMINMQIDKVEDFKVKLEDISSDPKPFLDKLNIKYDKSKLYTKKYNASLSRIPTLTLDYFKSCNPSLVYQLISLAKTYGYKID